MRKDYRSLSLAKENKNGKFQKTYYDEFGVRQPTKEYMYWYKFISRCGSNYQKTRPSYVGCKISPLFKDYDSFVLWCRQAIGFNEDGYHLDKDILGVTLGKKEYSEDTCVFIPQEINSFLTTKRVNITYYTGVSFQQKYNKYIVSCSQLNGKNKTLGRVDCPKVGYLMYKAEKVRLAKILADKYKNNVDPRVTRILSNFEVYLDLFTINPVNKKD